MGSECGGDRRRKSLAVDGQRAAGGDLIGVGGTHDKGAQAPHFLMRETDGVVLLVVGAKRVRADQFGEQCSLVGRGFADGTHLVKNGPHAERCDLPRTLPTSPAAAAECDALEAVL